MKLIITALISSLMTAMAIAIVIGPIVQVNVTKSTKAVSIRLAMKGN